jgi:hypothetical protein
MADKPNKKDQAIADAVIAKLEADPAFQTILQQGGAVLRALDKDRNDPAQSSVDVRGAMTGLINDPAAQPPQQGIVADALASAYMEAQSHAIVAKAEAPYALEHEKPDSKNLASPEALMHSAITPGAEEIVRTYFKNKATEAQHNPVNGQDDATTVQQLDSAALNMMQQYNQSHSGTSAHPPTVSQQDSRTKVPML